jgi:hypothetical protein
MIDWTRAQLDAAGLQFGRTGPGRALECGHPHAAGERVRGPLPPRRSRHPAAGRPVVAG